MDEDHDRVGRSIAAFLGEPIAHSGTGRQRRRHRARRPAGSPVPRSDVVLFVDGSPRDPRLGRAVATALRASTRESDEIVELPGGRLRVTLEADDAGSEAFVRRAREVVRPWLDVLGTGLDLRVDAPVPTNGGSSAAS